MTNMKPTTITIWPQHKILIFRGNVWHAYEYTNKRADRLAYLTRGVRGWSYANTHINSYPVIRLERRPDRIRSIPIACHDTGSYNGLSVGDKVVLTQDKAHYKTGTVTGFGLKGLYCAADFGGEQAVLFRINGEYAAQFRSHYVTIKKE